MKSFNGRFDNAGVIDENELTNALKEMGKDLLECTSMVDFNDDRDHPIMKSELHRCGLTETTGPYMAIWKFDIMQLGIFKGYLTQNGRLTDLHQRMFNSPVDQTDVSACADAIARCYIG